MSDAKISLPIYMDYQATTPLDPRVLEDMMPYLTGKFGNPHSSSHKYGWETADAVERARAQVAATIGAQEKEIVFTSGATESNNLAIKGAGRFYRKYRDHMITVATEHKCVLESMAAMEREGYSVTYLPVAADGIVDLDGLRESITERTLLVSVMSVNNEIGVIQNLAGIGAVCRERRVFFHTDAAQAVGKMPLDVTADNIDMMSISGHKLYGPKGIGALYVRAGARLKLDPIMSGGGQEGGLRSGTLSPALCVGLGSACATASGEMAAEAIRLRGQFDRFVDGIRARLPDAVLNGHRHRRIPGNVSLSFPDVDGALLLARLRELAVSSGAACASAVAEPSYVLRALGIPERLAQASIRFGIGRFTTDAEIDYAIDTVTSNVTRLRKAV
ncbi:aminotransferase class V-fold PLP-dependent enzyme [Iodidimonas sp. SYSU 1G8]|uniref:aminotransferase class V-fold PLP-dependent enzyme n=1 Tax=Iodidimonas sp. SYSU 1G8 TaxID=3133967 RepID=UPI0031FED112